MSASESMHEVRATDGGRYFSHDECEALFKRIVALGTGGGETWVGIETVWSGNVRWARNQITTSGDMTDRQIRIGRVIRGARAEGTTNKIDDQGLKLTLASIERMVRFHTEMPEGAPLPSKQQYLQPKLWGDSTSNLRASGRSAAAREIIQHTMRDNVLGAGYINAGISARAVLTTSGMNAYAAMTEAGYSVTMRNAEGTGSGWAGSMQREWSAIDTDALSMVARQKCLTSANLTTIEPGRYTLIMEPQAVHAMMTHLVLAMDRQMAEASQTIYTHTPGQSKIGRKILDERITLSTDPMDPETPYIPFDFDGYPYRAVRWVENGVLKELPYNRQYALSQLGHGTALPNPTSYRMSGGPTTIEEMIATTARGLLVTRFGGVEPMDSMTLMSTGVTRDGLWLIERGRIARPVQNMRFTESPVFVFNRVQQIGKPARVYWTPPVIVPPVKVSDFNFTSLSDAV